MAGLPCTQWIARCAAEVLRERTARPDARLSAAPRLRSAALRARRLRHAAAGAASWTTPARRCWTRPGAVGARVWVVSEYGHVSVQAGRAAQPRAARGRAAHRPPGALRRDARHLRQPGLRRLRSPAGPRLRRATRPTCRGCATCSPALPGVARVLAGEERASTGPAARPRSGELVALSRRRTPGSPIRSGSTTGRRRTTPAPWTSTASRATTRASCSSTRSCGGRRASGVAAAAEEARLPHAVRRGPAGREPGDAAATDCGVRMRPTGRCLIGDGPAPGRRVAHDGGARSGVGSDGAARRGLTAPEWSRTATVSVLLGALLSCVEHVE